MKTKEVKKMKHLNPLFERDILDFEFEAQILERNNRVADLLIKRGYKIKKPIWSGLVAS